MTYDPYTRRRRRKVAFGVIAVGIIASALVAMALFYLSQPIPRL